MRPVARLTDADIAWLEARLREAFTPVAPRAEFIADARQRLLHAPVRPAAARSLDPAVLLTIVLALLSLVAALWFFRRPR